MIFYTFLKFTAGNKEDLNKLYRTAPRFSTKPPGRNAIDAIGSNDHGRRWELGSGRNPAIGLAGGEGQGEREHEGISGYPLVVLEGLEAAGAPASERGKRLAGQLREDAVELKARLGQAEQLRRDGATVSSSSPAFGRQWRRRSEVWEWRRRRRMRPTARWGSCSAQARANTGLGARFGACHGGGSVAAERRWRARGERRRRQGERRAEVGKAEGDA
jgi:hypothetical protein